MFSMAISIIFLFQSLEAMESDQLTALAVFLCFRNGASARRVYCGVTADIPSR